MRAGAARGRCVVAPRWRGSDLGNPCPVEIPHIPRNAVRLRKRDVSRAAAAKRPRFRPARHYRGAGPRRCNGAGSSARCRESRGKRGAAGSRATGTAATVSALAAFNVEPFRRTEIKHAVRRKSLRAMRNFHSKDADAIRTRPGTAARPARETATRGDGGRSLNGIASSACSISIGREVFTIRRYGRAVFRDREPAGQRPGLPRPAHRGRNRLAGDPAGAYAHGR